MTELDKKDEGTASEEALTGPTVTSPKPVVLHSLEPQCRGLSPTRLKTSLQAPVTHFFLNVVFVRHLCTSVPNGSNPRTSTTTSS